MSKAIGEMNRLIEIKTYALTDDTHGGQTEGAQSVKRTLWVSRKERPSSRQGGTRSETAGEVNFSKEVVYVGRFRKSLPIVIGDIVRDDGKDYTIIDFATTDNEKFIEITVQR